MREPGWKMNESGELFDMSDAPFVEKPVAATGETAPSKAARQRLTAVLAELNPAGGKTEGGGGDKADKKKKRADRKKKSADK